MARRKSRQGLEMSKQITEAEFEALRPMNKDLVTIERDGEFSYETFFDYDGNEIAFATCRRGEIQGYTLVNADDETR